MKEIVSNVSDIRIDKYLSDELEISRSEINKMIDDEVIMVNNHNIKPSYKLKLNDIIKVNEPLKKESDLVPTKMDLNIVYEDDDIMVINKESGVVVHPGAGNKDNTLVNGLIYYTDKLSNEDDTRPGIVHRLDKDTSGLMLVCKSNKAHQILSEDFKVHNVKREYYALTTGVIPNNFIKIDAPIGRDKSNRKKMCVTAINSKNAITHLEVIKRYKKNTLVKLNLETGRTHQIRVHLSYIGYPVFNDPVYNHQVIKEYGQFLHSKTLRFIHPITKEEMYFDSDLPTYFQDYLDKLE